MLETVLLSLSALGVLLVAAMTVSQRRLLGAVPPPAGDLPAVSILKPLKGVDADLEANLHTFFALDYPVYEVVLGARDGDDEALAVARRVVAAHPGVPSRVIADAREVGYNPKVNNLANLLRQARHDVILISDSNVRVRPGMLQGMAAHLQQPGVGLVSSPITGAAGRGAGALLDGFQLNTFVMGGVAAMHGLLSTVCVVGKSMLLRREVLHAIGGFEHLSRYLAEDQVCGQEVAALGLKVVVTGDPVTNVPGRQRLGQFAARHLRWAKIRRRMSPFGYLGELLLSPAVPAVAAVLTARTWTSVVGLAVVAGAVGTLAAAAERPLGVRRNPLLYPAVALLRDLVVGTLWLVPWFSTGVKWRGNAFVLRRRTLLEPETVSPQGPMPSTPRETLVSGAA